MPFIENQGAKIYWDQRSVGEPVLLIMGLGYPCDMWWRIRPMLDSRYRTIVLDNRGAGRSSVPPGPYPMELMAADALAVLDAAGVRSAHVFGISMGGMIAQELALQHPERVRSLILGCTAAGEPSAVRAEAEVNQLLMNRSAMTAEQAAIASIPYTYDPGTLRDRIDEDLAIRRPWFPRPEAYNAQLQGILGWESYSRLPQLQVPTLVLHGETDRLVPVGNGELIAARIPGAKLVKLPHASHIFPTDQTRACNEAIMQFLGETQLGETRDIPSADLASPEILARARKIKLFLMDVDGTLTDGGVCLISSTAADGSGAASVSEMKVFNAKDGQGLSLAHTMGIQTGFITGRRSPAVAKRADELKVTFVYLGQAKKTEAFDECVQKAGVKADEVAYMGDDLPDIPLARRAGFAISVADGAEELKAVCHYTTHELAGRGAAREVIELILKAQGRWEEAVPLALA